MRSAYGRLLRLSSHPAFSISRGTDAQPLVCPLCPEVMRFGRIPEYDQHFMTHSPTREQGARWLSWRSFERLFPPEVTVGQVWESPRWGPQRVLEVDVRRKKYGRKSWPCAVVESVEHGGKMDIWLADIRGWRLVEPVP